MPFLLILFFLLFINLPSSTLAEEGSQETFYDFNLETRLEGEVAQIELPSHGMVYLLLERDGKRFRVALSPTWYYQALLPDLKVGDRVSLKALKRFSSTGQMIFVARELENLRTGKIYLFRDYQGRPLWRRRR